MKHLIPTLILIALFTTACRKSSIPPVSGTINGLPATTLYGTTGNATDYILLVQSTVSTDKLLSYNSRTYSYYNGTGHYIYIIISNQDLRRAILDTVNNKLDVSIDSTGATFLSQDYRER